MDRSLDCRRWCCSTKWAPAPTRTKAARWPPRSSNHFRQRGALLIATTHFDALKTWGTATEGVTVAAFAFDPQTFAPTYRLIYGAPGRSLAIEMAQRLGMPPAVIAAARGFLSDDQKRLQAHLDRVDAQARALDAERSKLERERRAASQNNAPRSSSESAVAEREEAAQETAQREARRSPAPGAPGHRQRDRSAEGEVRGARREGVQRPRRRHGAEHRPVGRGEGRGAGGARSHRRRLAASVAPETRRRRPRRRGRW